MSTPPIPPQFDLSGRLIQVGDWIVQSVSAGRCASIKIAKVVDFAKSGAIRACSWQFKDRYWDKKSSQWRDEPYWDRAGPYTVSYANRVFVIDESRVDPRLVEYINVELNGDPLYDPAKGKI